MDTGPLILVAQPHLAPLLPFLRELYDAFPLWEEVGQARLAEANVLVTAGEFQLDSVMLERMPRLGLIACFTVGYDGVDMDWARRHNVAVTHARAANDEDVADHAIGLIIAQRRAILEGDRQLRAGEWRTTSKLRTRSLGGARIGILGLGSIGMAIARRAQAMRMHVGWWGPNAKPDVAWPRAASVHALAQESDILVVAARADESNRNIISSDVIDALGPQGLLVNVARGQMVDEDALIAALREERLGGAALDVFMQEPTDPARWATVPNVVLTPHSAGATDAAVTHMMQLLTANLAAYFAGEPLLTPVK